jgi:hypothetical protein
VDQAALEACGTIRRPGDELLRCRDDGYRAVGVGHSLLVVVRSARSANPWRSTDDEEADRMTTPVPAARSSPSQDRKPPEPPLC